MGHGRSPEKRLRTAAAVPLLVAGIAPHRREVALPVPLVTGKLLESSPRVSGVRVAVAVLVRRWFPEPELEEEDSRKGAVLGSAGPHLAV